jgi:hypothetical protein
MKTEREYLESNVRETLDSWSYLPDFDELVTEVVQLAIEKESDVAFIGSRLQQWQTVEDCGDLFVVVGDFIQNMIDNENYELKTSKHENINRIGWDIVK